MIKTSHPLVAALALGALAFGVASHATDVSQRPLRVDALAKPNVIFGVDNSGSMDFEVMFSGTNDGALWWESVKERGWDASGVLEFNPGGEAKDSFHKFVYLFPNGKGPGQRNYSDNTHDYFAAAPTKQFAWMRSARFNPLYYDHTRDYKPWAPAYVNGAVTTFTNASPTAAKSHPVNGTSTINLVQNRFTTALNTTFTMLPGMWIPKGAQTFDGSVWVTEPNDRRVPTGSAPIRMAMSYYPATYWVPQACSPDESSLVAPDCALAPDGTTTLKRYEIRPENGTYPSGRTYAEEIQNFANWFQYYRKRTTMLAASMGEVLENLSGLRLGSVLFNSPSQVTMYEADALDPASNRMRVMGMFYGIAPDRGTPTRETLYYIGEQYRTNPDIVQYACQRNNAFIVTDGFANASSVTPPGYDPSKYGSGAPYQTTFPKTLADIALSYYTINVRPDLPTERVASTQRDSNPNQHMNTYAVTLGAVGELYKSPGQKEPPLSTKSYAWPNPDTNRSPTAVDDLWHATINGRGQMYLATTPAETAATIKAGLADILGNKGAQSSVVVSNRNLARSDGLVYLSEYDSSNWTGDLVVKKIDTEAGVIKSDAWTASTQLAGFDWTKRVVFSFNGSTGVPFTETHVGSLVKPPASGVTTRAVINYLRGSRAGEGSKVRARAGLLGPAINAEPVVSQEDGVVYLPTNEGMLHAFDTGVLEGSAPGKELWAYVPGSVLPEIGATAGRGYTFNTLLDATPALRKVGNRKYLVGGRGTGGAGYYALDVTQPRNASETELAKKVLWEFPTASSSADVKSAMGQSVGKPLIVTTLKHGTVVLLTSGYNTSLDGKGRVFMLNADTGAVIKEFVTTAGSPGAGDAGLAQLSAFGESDGTVRHVYGGDLLGNLWHFDLESLSVSRVAQFIDGSGNAQPVTSSPELAKIAGKRVVVVTTGRLLGSSDFGGSPRNSVYAVADTGADLGTARAQLVQQIYDPSTQRITPTTVDWSTHRGWFMDLPAGQIGNTAPLITNGVLLFATNKADMSDCSAAAYLYGLDVVKGDVPLGTNLATGTHLAYSLVSKILVVGTAGGKRIGWTREWKSRDILETPQPPAPPIPPRKNAWKEVFR